MIIAGVDPGLSGGLAFLNSRDYRLATFDMPILEMTKSKKKKRFVDCAFLGSYFSEFRPDRCYVEQVGAMPGQGVTSMFNFGRAVGSIDGIAGALLIPIHYVTPRQWKKHFGLVAAKDASRARAAQIFPANSADFKLKKNDGRAEAALIAEWGRRYEQGPA
tara:strand:+ start:85 stop:567 length:483 start_codon:yes stop_codon:yes gene_type:complete